MALTKIKLPVKQFREWQPEEIEDIFGIQKVQTLPHLEELIAVKPPVEHKLYELIEEYRKDANWLIEGWNEDEYKFLFISPFLRCVKFSTANFNVFTQRPLSLEYDNATKRTEGRVEWMLAKGRNIPKKPYFFIHEYKPEKRRENDPLGQVLIAMLAAQYTNNEEKPVYGMYINGRNWFLVVLFDNQYAVSQAYDITTSEIYDLFAILEYLKQVMVELYK